MRQGSITGSSNEVAAPYQTAIKLQVYGNGTKHTIEAKQGQTLLEALQTGGDVLAAPCGGKGVCGKCRVAVEGRGTLLACRTLAEDGMRVWLPEQEFTLMQGRIAEESSCGVYPADGSETVCAACDIGTTTVVCHLLDGRSGRRIGTASAPSAQRGFGADVLSRVHAAETHLELLHRQITEQIAALLTALCEREGITGSVPIGRLAVVGNTVMCHLFAGISPAPIGVTPFLPEEYFGKEYDGAALGLPMCRTVYIAPAAAGFVGGDITADLLAVLRERQEACTLLLDVGTNGEMALSKDGTIYCCATAVGSAFEGAELTCGMPATDGAISHVWLDKRRLRTKVIGEKARGICGSGLIDALAVLLAMGLVDPTGLLKPPSAVSVAYRRYLGEYQGQPCVWLADGVCMTQEDIRDLQLAKAAFSAGLALLLKEAGTAEGEVQRVVLAGGFGSYWNRESAAAVGLLPSALLPVTESVGNAASFGALSAAISGEARRQLAQIRKRMQYIELSAHPQFASYYTQHMDFDPAVN